MVRILLGREGREAPLRRSGNQLSSRYVFLNGSLDPHGIGPAEAVQRNAHRRALSEKEVLEPANTRPRSVRQPHAPAAPPNGPSQQIQRLLWILFLEDMRIARLIGFLTESDFLKTSVLVPVLRAGVTWNFLISQPQVLAGF